MKNKIYIFKRNFLNKINIKINIKYCFLLACFKYFKPHLQNYKNFWKVWNI